MKKYDYSNELANSIKQYLTEDKCRFEYVEEYGIFHFYMGIRGRMHSIRYIIAVQKNEVMFYGICPITVDQNDTEMLTQMSEFICCANYGTRNGNFELDFRDGEIRYKSYIDASNILPSKEIVGNSISCIAAMYELYSEGIADIIFGASSAEEAFMKCKNGLNGESFSTFSEGRENSSEEKETSSGEETRIRMNLFDEENE